MIPLTLPDPLAERTRGFTWLALSLCLLAAALIAERIRYWNAYLDTGALAINQTTPVGVSVGETRFLLPANYIAAPAQRQSALAQESGFESLRLVMSWPDLAAAPERYEDASAFGLAGETILVELESSPGRESLRARIEPFYRRLARSAKGFGPGGLRLMTLSPRGAQETDVIVFDPVEPDGFIARCLHKANAANTVCHRARKIGSGLELRFSFDQALLPQWRALERRISEKIGEFRQL